MNKKKTLRSVAKISINVITTSFVISVILSLILGILGWLAGFRAWSRFVSLLQFVAIVVLLLGLIGALSQSNLSLHDRQVVSWISNIHSIRDRTGHQPFLKKKLSGAVITAISTLSAAFLYILSRVISRFM